MYYQWIVLTFDHGDRKKTGERSIKNTLIARDYEHAVQMRDALDMIGQDARVMVRAHLPGHGNAIFEHDLVKDMADAMHNLAEDVMKDVHEARHKPKAA